LELKIDIPGNRERKKERMKEIMTRIVSSLDDQEKQCNDNVSVK
jgi:hypothetical protein